MDQIKRILAFPVAIVLWLWTVVPKAMDWVGRSTLPEDWRQLMDERLPAVLSWLFSTPWWVPGLFAAALTAWLMIPSRRRSFYFEPSKQIEEIRSSSVKTGILTPGRDARPSERDDQALEELTVFALDHVLPTIDELATLQKTMLRSQQGNTVVGDFAIRAIFHKNPNVQIVYDAYQKISELGGSPAPQYSLREMESFIHRIEQNYRFFVSQLYQITVGLGIDHRKEHEFTTSWQSWREKHDRMSAAYDVIRRSKKFSKLYRPGLPNRFNEGVG